MPENTQDQGGRWLSPVIYLSNNWISLAGVVIVTTATVFWLFLLPTTIKAAVSSPYIGILAYMGIPTFFFLGLLLIPLGMEIQRRKQKRAGLYPAGFPPLNWHNRELRKLVYFIAATTFANLIIASQVSYAAVNYMDSVGFCGQTCHTVMQPEYTAFQNSPHSRLECVNCHIGPGASWFVRSKLSGVGQVFAVTFNTYPRPIPTPVQNLRPARETCEQCHWPEMYSHDRIRVIPSYADDQTNTLTKTVLLLKIGTGNSGIGIHGTHVGPDVRIYYTPADESRQTITRVEYNGPKGKAVYTASDPPKGGKSLPPRLMDCMDCHNRPAHTFRMPDPAVNSAMDAGEIAADLPFAKKESLALLKAKYATSDQAARAIPASFENFYRQSYPAIYAQKQSEIEASARGVLGVFNRNVFPEMNVTWGDYPNDLGHTDFPGCFRCHDGSHTSAGGNTITQDCTACHNILAMDEANPKILTELGITGSQASKDAGQ